jgi:hypothetical protein
MTLASCGGPKASSSGGAAGEGGEAGGGAGGSGGDTTGSTSGGSGGSSSSSGGSGGATTTSTTTTVMGECTPGTTQDCYTGPDGTKDVGVCKAGTQKCSDAGAWGKCTGQVLPSPENCIAPTDEDCDGKAPACTGGDLWHKRFGDAGAQAGGGVAASNGGAVVCGTFAGTVDFGGGNVVSGGGNDAFVASYDAAGAHQWSKGFGDAAAQSAIAVAVDPLGNVFVVGDYAGKIDPGGGALTSSGLTDVFLAKYDPAGTFLWAKSFGDAKAQNSFGVAAGADGRVAITGMFAGNMTIGGNQLVSAGATDAFVAVLDKDGGFLWAKSFGDTVAQAGKAVAFGPMGEVVIAGDFAGTLNFGAGKITSAGATDVFLASFDKNGTLLWGKGFGDVAAQVANALAIDSVGNVVLAASFAGKIDFGSGLLTSAGGNDAAVARFSTGGMSLWARRYGGAMADNARGVAVDPFGAIFLAGDFTGSVDFGGGALASAGVTDVFAVKLDPLGNHLWSHKAGDAAAQVASGAAADPTGLFVTGTFAGSVDFGGGALTSAGGNDVFLVKLSP